MIEIRDEHGLRELLHQEHAVLFFHASWSEYAVLGRQIIEFVERYAKMGKKEVTFFFGEFEGLRLPLAEALVSAGVPKPIAFSGNGSLSFFHRGKHVHTMESVVGEGTWAVWKSIDELLGTDPMTTESTDSGSFNYTFYSPNRGKKWGDGTISVPAGGHSQGSGIWDGFIKIKPDHVDYQFWLWLLKRWPYESTLSTDDIPLLKQEYGKDIGTDHSR